MLASIREWRNEQFAISNFQRFAHERAGRLDRCSLSHDQDVEEHASEYYAPKNFNFWYYFGVLSLVVLVIQLISGIFLTMSYKPSAEHAFASVEYIMRDVEWGWLIPSTPRVHRRSSSSCICICPRLAVRVVQKSSRIAGIFGMLIYLVLMAEAFLATCCRGATCRTGERR